MNNEVIENAEKGLIKASGLHFGYPGRPLWAGASHCWPAGVCLVEGDEGSGKTSLLQVLAGRMALQSGQLQYAVSAVSAVTGWSHTLPAHELFWQNPRAQSTEAERNTIASDWVAQQVAKYPRWSAAVFERHAQAFDLLQHMHKPLLALSTGSLRKLSLAAGWASGAAIMLIDEPFAALDRPSERHVQQVLGELSREASEAMRRRCIIVAHWDAMQGVDWADVLMLPADRKTPLK